MVLLSYQAPTRFTRGLLLRYNSVRGEAWPRAESEILYRKNTAYAVPIETVSGDIAVKRAIFDAGWGITVEAELTKPKEARAAVVVHIGYQKCGSTWLQKQLFNNPGAGYYSPWKPSTYFDAFILANPFEYTAEKALEYFQDGLREARERDLVPVITHEALSTPRNKWLYPNRENADRLHAAFPNAHVLIVIREQWDMIFSMYKHRVRAGFDEPIERYLRQTKPGSGHDPIMHLDFLAYHYLIGYYQQLFGKERVLVLPYELLRRDLGDFANRIQLFAGLPPLEDVPRTKVNPGYGGLTTAVKQKVNLLIHANRPRYSRQRPFLDRLSVRFFYHFDRWTPQSLQNRFDERLRQFIAHELGEYYAESNRKTAALTGLDLDDFGYVV